jgi:ribose 5-phosphate isomerase B
MKIYLGTDHAGFELKEALKAALTTAGHTVEDMGAHSYDAGDDYPDFVTPVAHAVAQDVDSFGIVLGGSGQGEAMCTNRVPGVRTAVYYDGPMEIVRLAREHNNANILSLGARFVDEETAKEAVALFISTSFGNDERHARRLGKF